MTKIQELAEKLLKECMLISRGDIGGKLLARNVAIMALNEAADKEESKLANDSFEG